MMSSSCLISTGSDAAVPDCVHVVDQGNRGTYLQISWRFLLGEYLAPAVTLVCRVTKNARLIGCPLCGSREVIVRLARQLRRKPEG
jgi:hypothetical protein